MGFQELALLLLLFLPLCSAQSTYYITPTPDTPCPEEPCYNFPAVVDYLTPDAVLVFLPGNHSLETSIILTDLNSLTLAGDSSSLPQVTVSILCSKEANIVFTSIAELFITDIALVSCGTSSTASVQLDRVFQTTISNCIFQGGQNGTLTVLNSTVHLSNNTFTSNIATSTHGGGVYINNSTANIRGNIFINNSASGWGGGVYLEDSTVRFSNNLVKNNTARYGGGIEARNNSNVSATNNTFTGNIAGMDGGGIHIDSGVVANFMGNIFEYNTAQREGGGVYLTNSTVSFNNNLFQNNTASRFGGGIVVFNNSDVSATNNTFTRNFAVFGGGIEVYRNSIVSATNNTFTRNFADIAGGGIAIGRRVVANFIGNIFEYNKARRVGGGASLLINNTVSFTSDSFMFNTAVENGGGVWVGDSIVNITESIFTGNSAGDRGGGSYLGGRSYLESGTVIFRENLFMKNSALINGAGIYIALNTDSSECTNNTFRNNWGDGWVLFIEDSNRTSALLSQNAFENNTGNVVYGSSRETPSIYHITPSPDTLCPNEPCLTISEFIDQANQYIALNTTLMFLPGTHTVRSGLLVENITSLTLLGNSSVEFLPLIICDRQASLGFKYIDELFVHSLAFDSCGDGTYAALSMKSVLRIEISDCSFKNSISSGGAVVVANCNMLLITENVFENNSAVVGGGLYVNESTINFIGNTFTSNIAALRGAGVALLNCRATFTGMVTFRNNSGVLNGRELVNSDHEFREGFLSLTSVGTIFTGGAMFIYKSDVTFGNISIENNIATYGGGIGVLGSTISFSGLTDFANNYAEDSGGAVYAVDSSQLNFDGTSSFKYNTALNGGGLYLADSSLCYFSVTAQQLYLQNYARNTGGAIHVSDTTPSVYCEESSALEDLKSLCFFQIQEDIFQSDFQTLINFSSNTADNGGGDLYGGTIDKCKLSKNIKICSSEYCFFQSSGDVFNAMTTAELDIASVPLRVCYCEHQTPVCSQPPSVELYPGENFNVSVTVVGQRDTTVPTVIQTQVTDNIKIPVLQDTQKTTKSQLCSNLSFTVFAEESESGSLILSINSPCDLNSLMIQIHMQRCPPGFQLSRNTTTCICDERLEKITRRCDIETGTVFRPRGSEFWVGYENDTERLILHPHCPFDYCTEEEMNIDVNNSDTQCSYNRSGVLCGECGQNLSLALGSSRCFACSNSHLALLLPFATAGIMLVLFLFALKLTVSVGTIHGLIFYANVVQVNSAIFIPPGSTNPLTLFVAWLNLDLGIETCFYEGMDAYGKTWLQFVFPIYVWALVVIIIVVSHYSSGKIARLFGRNPIAVLATLFLLSYAKLLRTIIAAFAVTYAEYQGNEHVAVWLYDGNIKYLTGKHVPLFITAFLFLLLLFLPYTLLLLLSQWLQALQKCFFFINDYRIRAFLDAYYAPYNGKHRYWTGLLLCVRCILFLTIVFSALGDVSVNLLSISSAVVGLLSLKAVVLGGVYKNWYVGALETSFLLNLGILSTGTYHVRYSGGNQAAVTYTLLSIAFVTFAGILIYHSYLQIRDTALGEKICTETRRLSATRRYSREFEKSEFVDLVDSDATPTKLNTTAATYSTLDLSIRDSVVKIM